jgi:hypothetical protein
MAWLLWARFVTLGGLVLLAAFVLWAAATNRE